MGASGLGNLLVKEGFLTEQDRQTIVRTCGQGSWAFAKTILTMGLLDEDELAAFFAERTRFVVAPRDLLDRIDPNITKKIDKRLVSKLEILPIEMDHFRITVAVADPLDKATLRQLEFFTGLEVVPIIAPLSQIYEGLLRLNPEFRPSLTALTNFLRNHSGSAWVKQKIVENPSAYQAPIPVSNPRQGAHVSPVVESQTDDFELEDLPEPSHAHHSHSLEELDAPGFDQGFDDSDFSDIPIDAGSDADLMGDTSEPSARLSSGGVGFGFDFDDPPPPQSSAAPPSNDLGLWGDEEASDPPANANDDVGLWGEDESISAVEATEATGGDNQEDALDILSSMDSLEEQDPFSETHVAPEVTEQDSLEGQDFHQDSEVFQDATESDDTTTPDTGTPDLDLSDSFEETTPEPSADDLELTSIQSDESISKDPSNQEASDFSELLQTEGQLTEDLLATTEVLESILPEGNLPSEFSEIEPEESADSKPLDQSTSIKDESESIFDFSESLPQSEASALKQPNMYLSEPLPIEALGLSEDYKQEAPLQQIIELNPSESPMSELLENENPTVLDEDVVLESEVDDVPQNVDHDEAILNLVAEHGLAETNEDPIDISPISEDPSNDNNLLSIDLDPSEADFQISSEQQSFDSVDDSPVVSLEDAPNSFSGYNSNLMTILAFEPKLPENDKKPPLPTLTAGLDNQEDSDDNIILKRGLTTLLDDDHITLGSKQRSGDTSKEKFIPPPPPVIQSIELAHQLVSQLSLCFDHDQALAIASQILPQMSREGCLIDLQADPRIVFAWNQENTPNSIPAAFLKFMKNLSQQLPKQGWSRVQIPRSAKWPGKLTEFSIWRSEDDFLCLLASPADHIAMRDLWEKVLTIFVEKVS